MEQNGKSSGNHGMKNWTNNPDEKSLNWVKKKLTRFDQEIRDNILLEKMDAQMWIWRNKLDGLSSGLHRKKVLGRFDEGQYNLLKETEDSHDTAQNNFRDPIMEIMNTEVLQRKECDWKKVSDLFGETSSNSNWTVIVD